MALLKIFVAESTGFRERPEPLSPLHLRREISTRCANSFEDLSPPKAFTIRPEAGRLSLKFTVFINPHTEAARLPRPGVCPKFPLRKDYLP
jgi:hypothetical protein